MALTISTVPKKFKEGHNVQPGAYGSSTIFNGGTYAYIKVGDLEQADVVRIAQTNTVSGQTGGDMVEDILQRIPGINGQITVQMSDGQAVGADTNFDWIVTKF